MTGPQAVRLVSGRAVVVRGNDIDTDRIIPARYMKVVTFEGLDRFVFRDVRVGPDGKLLGHPFDDPARQGATVLVVNKNFGCGSSREHAPQALARWGIRAIVGESFAEIFFGNCIALGIPCLTLGQGDLLALQEFCEAHADAEVVVDVEACEVRLSGGGRVFPAAIPDGARHQLISGQWDALGVLLAGSEEIDATARRLAYIQGYASAPP